MPVKQWNVGDVLTSSDLNTWTVPLAAIKLVDTARASTVTVSPDPELSINVAANSVYYVKAMVRYKGAANTTSDAQFAITVPAATSGFVIALRINITGMAVGYTDAALGAALNAATNGTTNTMQILLDASITTTTTAGAVAVSWSQNTLNSTVTTVMTGSILTAQKIG